MNLKWSQQFQSYLNDFENRYKSSQTHLSPLGFALSQKILPIDQYLKWAQSTYHLPLITEDYFSGHLPSIEDWKSWKSEYQWTEEIVPIGIWDGHLLVACLEIPNQFPASFYPIFLLADFKNTQRTFQFYKNTDKGSESAKKLKDLIQQPEAQQHSYSAPASTHSQPKTTPKNDFQMVELSDEPAIEIIDDAIVLDQDQPEGLNLTLNTESVAASNPKIQKGGGEITFDSLDILSTPPKEEISLKFSNVEVNSGLSKKAEKDSVTGFTNTGMTSTKLGLTTNTIVGIQLPTNIQNEINKGLPYFIAIKKDNPSNFEVLTQGYFTKVTNLFDKFILIAIDPSELHAVPVSWSDNIAPRSKDLEKLDLTEPSIFKIVASTLKSYHGYIVLNENNEKFFEFWNQGQVPGNITMVPLIIRNKLVGMWMGLGESNTYNWNTLKQMEAKSKELCESFNNMFKDVNADAA